MSPKHSGRGTWCTDSQQTHPRSHTHTHRHTPHTLPRYMETQGTRTQPHTNIDSHTAVSQSTHTHAQTYRDIPRAHKKHTRRSTRICGRKAEDSKHPGTCCIDMGTSNAPRHLGPETRTCKHCAHAHTQPQSVCGPSARGAPHCQGLAFPLLTPEGLIRPRPPQQRPGVWTGFSGLVGTVPRHRVCVLSSPRPPASLGSQWDTWRGSGQESWSPAPPSQPSTWEAGPEEL